MKYTNTFGDNLLKFSSLYLISRPYLQAVQVNVKGFSWTVVIPDDAFYLFAQDITRNSEPGSKMNTFDWITLHYIWKGHAEAGYKESFPKLLGMGQIEEDTYFGYVLSNRYLLYKPHVKSITGQYDINHIQTVYHVIRRRGEASMGDFVTAFKGILTQKQVRNLIEGLCKTSLIASHGNARATRYRWM